MTQKEILHNLILGMDNYKSYGVPTPVWKAVLALTLDIYGKDGVSFLKKCHRVDDHDIEVNRKIRYHYLQKWEKGGNHEVLPKEIIKRLETIVKLEFASSQELR